jgi:nanoRNase/pAp phosphatase (c-di-AMP/oligoRNAs hydrolase)
MVDGPDIKPNPINQNRLSHMREVAGPGPVLILTHDSPDPDALASGKALGVLFNKSWDISCHLIYSGLVARAENQAMLNMLTDEWVHSEQFTELENYSALALVDTQPGAGNNSLPDHHIPHIVIDHHHPLREALNAVPYVDVRPEVGATSTMLYQYLEAADIVPDPILASAMFYGLQTDTHGLARGATPIDEDVYMKLLPLLDRDKLIKVEGAGVSKEYFHIMSQALKAARVYDRSVTAYLGEMHRPDLAAELADVFIRLKSAQAVLCIGCHKETLYLSLRTKPSGQDAGALIQVVVESLGKAGGHGNMAGGQVPLLGKDVNKLVAQLERRFLDVNGDKGEGDQLLSI